MATLDDHRRQQYEQRWRDLKIRPEREAAVERDARLVLRGKNRYLAIERQTGVPWHFVGLTHLREASCDFDKYLGNGQPLNRRTTIVPIGRGPFNSFEAGAVDALKHEGYVGVTDWSLPRLAFRLEGFNGFGYDNPRIKGTDQKLGHSVPSPYLYGGSTVYDRGKYTRDHYFDPDKADQQNGVLTVLKKLMQLDPTISINGAPATPIERDKDDDLHDAILWVQQSLNKLIDRPDLRPLVEDGMSGPNTKNRIALFQRENLLKETGLPDSSTVEEIKRHLSEAARGSVQSPAPPVASRQSGEPAPLDRPPAATPGQAPQPVTEHHSLVEHFRGVLHSIFD